MFKRQPVYKIVALTCRLINDKTQIKLSEVNNKMANDGNNSFALMAMVAIVAVVGVVGLVMSMGVGMNKGYATQPVVMADDANSAGQAVYRSSAQNALVGNGGNSNSCSWNSDCPDGQVCVREKVDGDIQAVGFCGSPDPSQ